MQNRLRSKALWTAVLAFMLLISKIVFKYEIPMGDELVNGVLGILTLAGIFNNPTDKENF
jgi:uncharacterized membrane protein